MGIVSTIPEKCRRCYACVRECPANAIKVENGQALVIAERCIACGRCVKVCTQHAKLVKDSAGDVLTMLAGEARVFACLAPSFPAAFDKVAPGKVIAGLQALGFDQVWNVSFGAELVAREYVRLFEASRFASRPVISSPCPAIVAYIERYMPGLRDALAPIVSPMIATARAIQARYGDDVKVVFIGPCIAKKNEIRDPLVGNSVKAVLTFRELLDLFDHAGIVLDELDECDFDGPRPYLGGAFPLSGGLLRTAGLPVDVLDNDILIADGKTRALQALEDIAEGTCKPRFLDVLYCKGCINGPHMVNDLGLHARKEILSNYVSAEKRWTRSEPFAKDIAEFKQLDLRRDYTPQDLILLQPSEEEIGRALCEMKKFAPEDQLNCGACGYPTCREKAIAVCQGLAESSMCLPYLIEELEDTCGQLQHSHRELERAQQRLVQTERMASMGQLSAGVAHELNNPLGTVIIYSHMLLRHLREDDPRKADLEMVAKEAGRCKNIVRGLLDFARQSRVSKAPTDLPALVKDIKLVMTPKTEERGVDFEVAVDSGIPTMMIDGDQIKQMLINLVSNAIDAIHHPGGKVTLHAQFRADYDDVVIQVTDNGDGIPQENLGKLFTPFFTTKEIGQGTGLGLAIAYGIVKMHSGDIRAESELGQWTTFTITLPVGNGESAEPPPATLGLNA